jgi:hypothetical protein
MKLPHATADQSIEPKSWGSPSYANGHCNHSAFEDTVRNQAGITMQGCSDYTLNDLKDIAATGIVGCATLGGQRAVECVQDHDNVNEYCGINDCESKRQCLKARKKTMSHFDAAITQLENCKKNNWKRDQKFRGAANAAIEKLSSGSPGHQRQINLVRAWIKNKCP